MFQCFVDFLRIIWEVFPIDSRLEKYLRAVFQGFLALSGPSYGIHWPAKVAHAVPETNAEYTKFAVRSRCCSLV